MTAAQVLPCCQHNDARPGGPAARIPASPLLPAHCCSRPSPSQGVPHAPPERLPNRRWAHWLAPRACQALHHSQGCRAVQRDTSQAAAGLPLLTTGCVTARRVPPAGAAMPPGATGPEQAPQAPYPPSIGRIKSLKALQKAALSGQQGERPASGGSDRSDHGGGAAGGGAAGGGEAEAYVRGAKGQQEDMDRLVKLDWVQVGAAAWSGTSWQWEAQRRAHATVRLPSSPRRPPRPTHRSCWPRRAWSRCSRAAR